MKRPAWFGEACVSRYMSEEEFFVTPAIIVNSYPLYYGISFRWFKITARILIRNKLGLEIERAKASQAKGGE